MKKLLDHTILITGASSGIGLACAMQAAELGATVILCARRIDRIQAIAKNIQEQFQTSAHCLAMDVRDRNSISNALKQLPLDVSENISVLINNAGLGLGSESIQNGEPDDWDVMIDTNIKGLLYMTKAILPNMLKRNQGHIVNIGSIAGTQVYPKGVVYCATKSAVRAISEGLKMDVLGSKIRVTEIEPGMVETEFSVVRAKGDTLAADQIYAGMTPLTADDIAETVLFAITRPPHVNLSNILILPTDQASVFHVHRDNQ